MAEKDPHLIALSMAEKIKDPQTRATLSYMLGMLKFLDIKVQDLEAKVVALSK